MKENKHGGHRENAGRKPKTEELLLVSKLDTIISSDDAIKKLKQLIEDGNFPALKLYMEYRFGKPKETVENINHNFNEELTDEDIKRISKILKEKY